MGFLDNKGLKKVVNWVKDYVKNNSLAEEDPQNKQDIWETATSPYVVPYKINILTIMGFTIVFDAMLDYGGSIIPDSTKEYKIRGTGQCLKNTFFPSTFDMPWPNNEIPKWENDHEYEIYIAGGRVVSVDDITPPIEEVAYIIEASEGCTFNLGGGTNWLYKLNNSNWNSVDAYIDLTLSVGENVVYIRNTSRNGLINVATVKITNYNYLKVDCSKMKSTDLHKVLGSLKVDEIIYPQACVGYINMPIYDFESPEVDLRCLKYNILNDPTFNFKTDNFKDIFFEQIAFNTNINLFGENISNINANKILRTIVLSSNSPLSRFNLEGLKTVGTLYDSIPIYNTIYDYFKFCNFYLRAIPSSYDAPSIEADEFIFNTESSMSRVVIQGGAEPKKVFIENMENLDYTIVCEFDVPCTIYYVYGDPSEIHIIGRGENLVSFTKVNSVEEVPFQYAPTSWNDVKNYDDDGNVID